MSIEQQSPEEYYAQQPEPIIPLASPAETVTLSAEPIETVSVASEPLASAAPAPTLPNFGLSDQMLLGFMIFGAIVVTVTVFGFSLMWRSK